MNNRDLVYSSMSVPLITQLTFNIFLGKKSDLRWNLIIFFVSFFLHVYEVIGIFKIIIVDLLFHLLIFLIFLSV